MLEETADRAVARLEIRDEHKTPTGVVHSGTILSLADDCATRAANRANDEGPNPGAFMVLVDLHSAMLGNQSEGILTAVSTILKPSLPLQIRNKDKNKKSNANCPA